MIALFASGFCEAIILVPISLESYQLVKNSNYFDLHLNGTKRIILNNAGDETCSYVFFLGDSYGTDYAFQNMYIAGKDSIEGFIIKKQYEVPGGLLVEFSGSFVSMNSRSSERVEQALQTHLLVDNYVFSGGSNVCKSPFTGSITMSGASLFLDEKTKNIMTIAPKNSKIFTVKRFIPTR